MGHALSTFLREQCARREMFGSVVAERFGLSRQLVSKWLTDDRQTITRLPDRATLQGFATALGVSTDFRPAKAVESTGLGYSAGDFVSSIECAEGDKLLAEIQRRLASRGQVRDGSAVSLAGVRRQRMVDQGQPQKIAAYDVRERQQRLDDLLGARLGPLDDEDDVDQDPGGDTTA